MIADISGNVFKSLGRFGPVSIIFLALGCLFWLCNSLLLLGEHNSLRVVQSTLLLLVFTIVATGLFCVELTVVRLPKIVQAGTLALFLGGALSAGICGAVFSFLEYIHWLLLFALMFFCAQRCERDEFSVAVSLLLLLHGYFIFKSILNVIFAVALGDPLASSIIYSMGQNVRFFNQAQLLAIPLLLFLPFRVFGCYFRILFLVSELLLVLVGGARGVMLCVLILLIFLYFFSRWKSQFYILLVSLLISGLIFVGLKTFKLEGMIDIAREGSSNRIDMWLAIWQHIGPRFLLIGDGPGVYPHFPFNFGVGHLHNIVMQMLFEWGGLGLVGFVLVFFGVIYRINKTAVHVYSDPFLFSVYLSFGLNLVYALLDGVFVMPIPQTVMFIFLGFLLRECAKVEGLVISKKVFISPGSKLLVGVLLVLVNILYIASMMQQFNGQIEGIGPRFWAMGSSSKAGLLDYFK